MIMPTNMENRNFEKAVIKNYLKAVVVIIIVILLTLFLSKIYLPVKTNTVVRIKNPQFRLLGPYHDNQYELNDVYDQLIDLNNFTFLINPQVCLGTEAGLLLLIIISSKPDHFEQRMLIRRTWGRAFDATKVVFLMGETEKHLMKLIEKESLDYADIIQGNFIDAYRNLTYKHAMGLKWVSHHCHMARYVLKADDDSVINSHELQRFLVRELSPWGARGLIICKVYNHPGVPRSNTSKWWVSEYEYAGKYYPNYCAGYSILYSQDVVQKLLAQVQALPYFWIDDVQITGIAAKMQKIARTPLVGQILSYADAKLLTSRGPRKYISNFLFGPPQLKADQIKAIWQAIPQYRQ